MARRRQARASQPLQQEPQQHACIEQQLSDDVLERCLRFVPTQARLTAASLVCKRWRAVCQRPTLPAAVALSPRKAAQAASLAAWLTKYGSCVVHIELTFDSDPQGKQLKVVAAALPRCRNLCNLKVAAGSWFSADALLRGLTALQSLHLEAPPCVEVGSGLAACTQLVHLTLDGAIFLKRAVLPPSLTYLWLCGMRSEALPTQVSALAQLAVLGLEACPYLTTEGCVVISTLTTLTALHLGGRADSWESEGEEGVDVPCLRIPPGLQALTGLKSLTLVSLQPEYEGEDDMEVDEGEGGIWGGAPLGERREPAAAAVEQLDAVLRHLSNLTALNLLDIRMDAVPASVGQLAHLRQLCITECGFACVGGWNAGARLPAGPWQRSVRTLTCTGGLLDASCAVLAGCDQLEDLEMHNCFELDHHPLLHVLEQREGEGPPRLRRLKVQMLQPEPKDRRAVTRLKLRRPDLTVELLLS